MDDIKTPETHPDHETVGHDFKGLERTYFCDSYDPKIGFWMTGIDKEDDRRNVSERAINRTFHHSTNCRKCVKMYESWTELP